MWCVRVPIQRCVREVRRLGLRSLSLRLQVCSDLRVRLRGRPLFRATLRCAGSRSFQSSRMRRGCSRLSRTICDWILLHPRSCFRRCVTSSRGRTPIGLRPIMLRFLRRLPCPNVVRRRPIRWRCRLYSRRRSIWGLRLHLRIPIRVRRECLSLPILPTVRFRPSGVRSGAPGRFRRQGLSCLLHFLGYFRVLLVQVRPLLLLRMRLPVSFSSFFLLYFSLFIRLVLPCFLYVLGI